ncbi:ABC-three component system middle component 2 [Actinoplanes sp. M2I2]|uniref:ABC-three component system middle component 2 n=1 Tax=Actinoplanes sp. M2I2 TaxID=1734444 RepID=UPI002021E1A2|nr:ABC-three component system middle component 2 [Actinoplanes sp. M2I2]
MNGQPLNGPLEIGLRALALLISAFPRSYDIATLAFLDYSLLHSNDFGGPESLHPDVPNHQTEITVKRDLLELGLQVMMRARLVALEVESNGIRYAATENASGFVDLLESSYVDELKGRADWVVQTFGGIDPVELRSRMTALGRWTEFVDIERGSFEEAGDE